MFYERSKKGVKMKSSNKVFCVYNDGNHIQCYETEQEAIHYIEENISSSNRYLEYEMEDELESCDCGGVK